MKKIIVIFVVISLAVMITPWKDLLEHKLKQMVADKGISNLQFSVESVGLNNIEFNNIEFGELQLPALSVSYNPFEILGGNFKDIHAGEIAFNKGGIEIILSGVDVNFVTGLWLVNTIKINDAPIAVPSLSGQGKVSYQHKIIDLTGAIQSADKKFFMDFVLNYPTINNQKAAFNIKEITMPWGEGNLTSRGISVSIHSEKPIAFDLGVKRVSLNTLLTSATGNKATATGVVSGVIPVVFARDGSFTIKKASLKAEDAGKISMSPDVIPSDAPEVALLRELLKDFHYSDFLLQLESADTKQLVMLLSLMGNNPDVYNGRIVKFNVNLTGDVIELIMQSLAILKN